MIVLDGSKGGGQVLRTGIALAAIKGEEIEINNIRATRPNPGLRAQHIESIKAMQQTCNATVSGLEIGSKKIVFAPQELEGGEVSVKINTAGSVGLVLQPLMIAAPFAQEKMVVQIEGGATYGKWAPPVDYLKHVLLPNLEKFGFRGTIKVEREGFFPVGGALVTAEFFPAKLSELKFGEAHEPESIKAISIASEKLQAKNVAERQVEAAQSGLDQVESSVKYIQTACIGSGITLYADCKTLVLGGDSLGEKNKTAEQVGSEAAKELNSALGAGVDKYTADQLVPFLALSGKGEVSTTFISDHTKTNIWVVEKVLNKQIKLSDKKYNLR